MDLTWTGTPKRVMHMIDATTKLVTQSVKPYHNDITKEWSDAYGLRSDPHTRTYAHTHTSHKSHLQLSFIVTDY